MKFGSRLSYDELEDFIFSLQDKVTGHFLKNIYHYKGKWLFKFQHISFVYDGQTIWNGTFQEREELHVSSYELCNIGGYAHFFSYFAATV